MTGYFPDKGYIVDILTSLPFLLSLTLPREIPMPGALRAVVSLDKDRREWFCEVAECQWRKQCHERTARRHAATHQGRIACINTGRHRLRAVTDEEKAEAKRRKEEQKKVARKRYKSKLKSGTVCGVGGENVP